MPLFFSSFKMDENDAQQLDGSSTENLSERIALLQEIYQRKHAEFLAQLQQQQSPSFTAQDYLQTLQLFPSLASAHPQLGSLRQGSSEQSTEDIEMQTPNSAKDAGPAALRNRRYTLKGYINSIVGHFPAPGKPFPSTRATDSRT